MNVNLILDSAAFQAWRLGEQIDIGEYADFILANKESIWYPVNLDVIPGRFGKKPTNEEVEESAQKGWENAQYLESRGIRPLVVFHQGESFYWLERMLKEGYEYVGISPDNSKSVSQKRGWLDRVFTLITDGEGRPKVKTHGFAVTSIDLMCRYPWASMDSATWIQLPAFGSVMIPKWHNNRFVYNKIPYVVSISSKGKSSMKQGTHFNSLGPETKKKAIEYFESEGYTLEQVSDDFMVRSFLAIRVFENVRAELKQPRFKHHVNDLFLDTSAFTEFKAFDIEQTKVVYALSCAAIYSDALTLEGVKDRLFSYHILKTKPQGFFDFYARNGVFPIDRCWKRYCDAGNIGDEKPLEHIEPDESKATKRKAETKIRNWGAKWRNSDQYTKSS